ncbi:MAG: hypothetical protein HFE97_03645 [Oscillospiraceae bacterium]|nr:hypothetical protein [Oscillospiraceae bacterium]
MNSSLAYQEEQREEWINGQAVMMAPSAHRDIAVCQERAAEDSGPYTWMGNKNRRDDLWSSTCWLIAADTGDRRSPLQMQYQSKP